MIKMRKSEDGRRVGHALGDFLPVHRLEMLGAEDEKQGPVVMGKVGGVGKGMLVQPPHDFLPLSDSLVGLDELSCDHVLYALIFIAKGILKPCAFQALDQAQGVFVDYSVVAERIGSVPVDDHPVDPGHFHEKAMIL